MIKTFEEAVKFLESYIPPPEKKHPGNLGLERMKYLMNLLDNPQDSYPTIHVSGTSGKGSTGTIIASILATKYKVGLHTSPHLIKITERIKIGSKNISDDDFIDLLNEVYPAIKKVEESKLGSPSYFEIVTAMAFLYFIREKVDTAVIEVGMGGRYDATNVIKPLVAVITNVGLDHTEILGDTVEKIAEDKAGIIKHGISVISGVKQPSVIDIISVKCKVQNAKLSVLKKDFDYKMKRVNDKGSIFDYFGENTYRDLKISLLGRHQVENAAIALRAIELIQGGRTLPGKVRPLKEEDIREGLSNSFIPARLEIVSRKPLVILDGAHNQEKMKALVSSIKEIFPKKKVRVIIAIKSGKDAQGILKEILPICHEVIFTKFQLTTDLGDTFSYEPSELLEITSSRRDLASSARSLLIKDNPAIAVKESIRKAKQDDLILVTGSLYLIGEIKKIFNF